MSAGTQESVPKPGCHSTLDVDADVDTDQSPQAKLENRGVVKSVRGVFFEVLACTSWPFENGGLVLSSGHSGSDADDG